jgi:hypothetical protein
MKEEIDKLCLKYNLSEKIKKEILNICSKSYVLGSNHCDEVIKKFYHLVPKNKLYAN